jgi:hypothetical protein
LYVKLTVCASAAVEATEGKEHVLFPHKHQVWPTDFLHRSALKFSSTSLPPSVKGLSGVAKALGSQGQETELRETQGRVSEVKFSNFVL